MLYIDCGHTASGTHYTGIQRYVRRTLRHAVALLGEATVRGISAEGDRWTCLAELPVHPLEGLPALALTGGECTFDANTSVLLADRFWHTGAWTALDRLLESEARVTPVVYDLLSIRQPQWFPPGVGERFSRHLRKVLPCAAQVICLSNVVREDLGEWARAEGIRLPIIHIVAPGHQVWEGEPVAPPSLPPSWIDGTRRFVLQVGTLEPRKNHALTLEAMRAHWAGGGDTGCLFVGQRGWLTDGFARELERAPEWGERLLWLAECTDAQLDWAYRHAGAVLYPSAEEGYGLPPAEAAAVGARLIISKAVGKSMGLDVDRTVAILDALHPRAIQDELELALGELQPRPVAVRGWDEATAELLGSLR